MKETNLVTEEEGRRLLKGKSKAGIWPQEWAAHGLPIPDTEHQFCPDRKWAIDIAFTDVKLAIELEGFGAGGLGRHQRIAGFLADIEKYNAMVEMGWTLLRYPADRSKINFVQIKNVYEKLRLL